MKRYTLLIIIAATCFIGCGIRKESEVRSNYATGELEYVVWVYRNSEILESFRIPITIATCERRDSLNREADNLIKMVNSCK